MTSGALRSTMHTYANFSLSQEVVPVKDWWDRDTNQDRAVKRETIPQPTGRVGHTANAPTR